MSHHRTRLAGAMYFLTLTLVWGPYVHPEATHSRATGSTPHDRPTAPVRITAEELHRGGGVPPGWKFRFPAGDPEAGRRAYAKLECYACHTIRGEIFPQIPATAGNIGPELTGMGGHHPAEYFAESVLNPDAVIVTGPGYTAADGMSIMPDYRDSMTVAELIDLVAYLQSLKGGEAHDAEPTHDRQDDHSALLDQLVGDYRIRVLYHEGRADHQGRAGHAHRGHKVGTARAKAESHLMAFITDGKTGEPVPYLPVSATIAAAKQSPRTVQLKPMMGDAGFHYGADITLPSRAAKLTLSVGPTTMHVTPSASERYSNPQQVSLDWTPRPPASPGRKDHWPQHQSHGNESGAKGH